MKHSKQDIYGTDRHKEEPLHVAKASGDMREGLDRWGKEVRRVRYHAILFSLTILALVVFIVLALIFFYEKPAKDPDAETDVPTPTRVVRTELNEDPAEMYMMDELSEIKPEPEPREGNLPLNEKWIKQAAFHLTQAKKEAHSGYIKESLEHYVKALWIYPELKGVHRHMGLLYLKLNEFESAAGAFEQALLEEQKSYGIANNLGVSYLQMDKEVDAEKLFLYALNENPDYPPAMYNLATLYVKRGLYDKALPRLKKHISLNQGNAKAAFTYAYVLIQLQQWDEAATILLELAEENAESPPVFFRLAQALTHINKQDDAVTALVRGTSQLDPENALEWIKKITDYQDLRNHPGFQALVQTLTNRHADQQEEL